MKKTNNPIAFIAGITGQDGAQLAALLLQNGYVVYGGFRRGSTNKMWRTDFLGITKQIKLVEFQLTELQHIIEIFKKIQPDEIYNLAGESFVADSFDYPSLTMDVNTHGTINILEAARLVSPQSRIFFASSSEVFGYNPEKGGLNENSIRKPCNPYAISKLAADNFVKLYREKYGLFACSGILFNHEGPIRSRHFVSRKITYNMVKLKSTNEDYFELGNFSSTRDWGAAVDYVSAMKMMLELEQPTDLVVSTGKLTTVRELLELAAKFVGFTAIFEGSKENELCIDKNSGRILAKVSDKYYRPFDTLPMRGDSTLIKNLTGWQANQSISKMINLMIEADFSRRKKGILDV